jgi:hypothetical protein
MTNYLAEAELNQVKGLLHYLNQHFSPSDSGLAADVTLTDSNGENVGLVSWEPEPGAGYVLRML